MNYSAYFGSRCRHNLSITTPQTTAQSASKVARVASHSKTHNGLPGQLVDDIKAASQLGPPPFMTFRVDLSVLLLLALAPVHSVDCQLVILPTQDLENPDVREPIAHVDIQRILLDLMFCPS